MLNLDLTLFAALFIFQFVGHKIGDYILQTDHQAQFKTKDDVYRMRHSLVYAATIALLLFPLLGHLAAIVTIFVLTVAEHMLIDDRRFVRWLKTFVETNLAGRKDFDIEKVPTFVIIEIDQTIHLIRIFLISLIFASIYL